MRHYLRRTARPLAFIMCALAAFWLSPAMAFAEQAAEEAHDSGSIGLPLLLPKMGEFIPMLIGFLVLLVVLVKFGWPVILDMLERRVETIQSGLEQAEAARLETAQLLDEQKAMLGEARTQAALIITEAKAQGEATRAEIEAQAQDQAEAMLAHARNVIEHEKNQAMLELRTSVADISVALAGRLIGSDLSADEHRQIIERYVAQAGSFDDN